MDIYLVQLLEQLFSVKNRKLIKAPLDDNNPITVQVLGICSALALTVKMKPTLVMAISVIVVCAFAILLFHSFGTLYPKGYESLCS